MKDPFKRNRTKIHRIYKKYGLTGLILLTLSILSIIIGLFILIEFFFKISNSVEVVTNNDDIDKDLTGIIGDFVGGIVGTLWSLAGVILFFLALRLQSKELSLQIKEMRETRNVFQIQQFENTFFNLLKTHNEIKDNITINKNKFNEFSEKSIVQGNEALEYIKELILKEKEKLNHNLGIMGSEFTDANAESFEKYYSISYDEVKDKEDLFSKLIYKVIFLHHYSELSHYFRNLYHILLFIKENEDVEISQNLHMQLIGEKNRILINNKDIDNQRIKEKYKKYSQFLQAQMSNTEMFVVFYNALFFPKSKRLVQYYKLLQNLNRDDLLYPNLDEIFYKEYKYQFEIIPELVLKKKEEILKI